MTSSHKGGLSTGAIAGIAAACGVLGLCALGAGIWFVVRHRRRRQGEGRKSGEDASIEMVYPVEPPSPPQTGAAAAATAEWASKEPAVRTEKKRSSRPSRRHRDQVGEEEVGEMGHRGRHRK